MERTYARMILVISMIILVLVVISGCTSPVTTATPTPTRTSLQTPVQTPADPQTRTLTQTPTPTQIQQRVLFSDDFSVWRSEWDPVYDGSSGKIFYSGGALHIRDDNPPSGMLYQTLNKNYDDFTVDVDMTCVGGTIDNWQAVGVRCQDEKNYYHLSISADGYYEIVKFQNGVQYMLAGPDPIRSYYINTGIGAVNHVRGEIKGNTFSLFVNDHHLSTVTDSSFRDGELDLSVNAMPSNSYSEVAFDNFTISTI